MQATTLLRLEIIQQRHLVFVSVSASLYVGGYSAGWRDPKRTAEASVSHRAQTSGQAQDRTHPVHDGVVHVCLFQNPPLGLGAPGVGHVLV